MERFKARLKSIFQPWTLVPYKQVAAFYVLACLISWPMFWLRDKTCLLREWGFHPMLRTTWIMWGPGLAALLIQRGRKSDNITLLGPSPNRSLLFYIVPFFMLAVLGLPTPIMDAHLLPIFSIGGCLCTSLGEEMGWRGYLQDALRPIPTFQRYALVGVMWEFWHFTTRFNGPPSRPLAVYYAAVFVCAVIIGWATDRSRSVLVAAAFHSWINIFEYACTELYITAGAVFVFWSWMLYRWPQNALSSDIDPVNSLKTNKLPPSA